MQRTIKPGNEHKENTSKLALSYSVFGTVERIASYLLLHNSPTIICTHLMDLLMKHVEVLCPLTKLTPNLTPKPMVSNGYH